jgi:phospholipase/carboxylesterase
MTQIKNYYTHGNETNPQSIIFLLHGLGSNGRDLISLAPYWDRHTQNALFISPDAPFACDMVPPGYPDSFQWFSLQSRDRDFIGQGIKIAFPILQQFIEAQAEKFKIPMNKIALAGFSQGTMMSLYTAPRLPETIAGVLGYSGALYGEDALIQDPDEFRKPPIHLIHGEHDDVVPFAAYHHAREGLESAGFDVTGHTTPHLAHSIDEKGISSGGAFLSNILE